MPDRLLKPLTALVPEALWPAALRGNGSGSSLFDKVFFTDYDAHVSPDGLAARLTVVTLGEAAIGVPGVEGLAFVIAPGQVSGTTAIQCWVSWAGDRFDVTLQDVTLALRFPPEVLAPVAPAPGQPVPAAAQIEMHGSITLNERFDLVVRGFHALDLKPAMIGRTGLIVEAEGIIPDLSRVWSPPEVLEAGFSDEFIGVFARNAKLRLPPSVSVLMPTDLVIEHCAIGTEGFAGRVAAEWSPVLTASGDGYTGPGSGTLFGVPFGLRRFALELKQNTIVASDIHGELILPFFDRPVGVDLGLGLDGDFTVGLSAAQPAGVTRTPEGLIELTMPGLLTLAVARLGLEKQGADVRVKIGGRITLLYGGLDWPAVEVRELSIDQHGHVHIDGGWLDLPASAAFDFGGFTMALDRIGFGNADDGRKWVGFAGQIRLVEELAFGASVDGLKILWDAAGHVDLQLSRIAVELTIPDTLAFTGFVEYFQDGPARGFRGDVTLALDAGPLAFDAQLMVGRNTASPPYSFFYVLVDADLPVGIPLGQTNTAIYGFSGLLGNNVAPRKEPSAEWYAWYRAAPVGATPVAKWGDARGALALGAGVTLGTAADNGFAFAAKVMLVLLLPGPLLLIDGKGNLLKDRAELAGASEGDFRTLAVLDRRAGTLRVNLQPHFTYDLLTHAMLDVIGVAEGFFDFNDPDAWHVYLGEQPPAKRIRGTVVKLLQADAYLMLDRAGLRLGASAGIDRHYDYGALSVALKAIIEGEAAVSWRPTQLDGRLTIAGLAALRAFGSSASVTVDAALSVQTPRPFHVDGSVRVRLKTPWPLPDPSARIRFEWSGTDDSEPPPPTVAGLVAEQLHVTQSWRLDATVAAHAGGGGPIVAAAPGPVPATAPSVPLDAKLVIAFTRPVVDRALIGANGGPAPRPERVGAVEIGHELLAVTLERRDGATWTAVESRDQGTGDLFGMWLPLPAGDRAAGKLQLWGRSPFTYSRAGGRGYADGFTRRHPAYPCVPDEPAERWCFDLEDATLRVFPPLFVVGDLVFEFLFSDASMRPQLVPYASPLTGTKRALRVTYGAPIPLRITPPAPCASVSVFVSRPAAVTVTLQAFRDGQVIASGSSVGVVESELIVTSRGIEYVELTASGAAAGAPVVLVLRACGTPQVAQDRAALVGRIRTRIQSQLSPGASWCGEDHLLAPDATYRLTVTTQIRTWRDGQEVASTPHDDVRYFRTQGPPGFFETSGRLRDLAAYIDPAASAPAHGADPVYRGYDLRVVFTENYLERLYKGTGHDLTLVLVDQNGQPARSATGTPAPVTTVWDRDPYGASSPANALWRWTIARPGVTADGCGSTVGDECIVRPSTLEGRLSEAPLAPRALIEARVTAAGRAPLHRFSFVTSRFTTFVDHIQSFDGGLADRPLAAGSGPALTPAQRTRLAQIVEARRQAGPGLDQAAEAAAFDELATSLFLLGARPPSDRLEIALLRDETFRYALLIESPEPLDWTRTALRVRLAAATGAPAAAARGPVRVIDAALSPGAGGGNDYNAEWVEILLGSETNVSGFAIEHGGGLGESVSFTTYYRFGDEPSLPAGTAVRVHAGSPGPSAPTDDERLHRYVTAPGEAATWRLGAGGDTVRLLDAGGTEVQRWAILPASAFEERAHVALRNIDQTRAFLFFSPAAGGLGAVPAGLVRLAWTFLRDVGAGGVFLKRRGHSAPETTVIEVLAG